ncbi:MAG: hypothetical protein IMW95_12645 [Moorella humiferrea]|nr:hypothetical protein [Moorella humiferrea]
MNRIAKKVGFFVFLLLFISITLADRAEAYTYTVSLPTGAYSIYYDWTGGIAVGYNVTQGYAQNLPMSVIYPNASITVPDDGCTWQISGFVAGSKWNSLDDTYEPVYRTFSTTVTTSGKFSGYSPKTATDAANVAATNAQNAYNAANSAAANAQNAYNAANTAASAAQAAQSAASTAATNAQNAYNAANTAANQTIYNGQSAAYWAYQAAQGGTDTTPPTIQKVAGQNGATCTSTGTFYVVVQATDNRTGQLQARAQVDGGTWTGWYNIPQNAIPVSLSSVGAHTITVEVKDAAGNSSQATMTAFRV